MRRLVHPGPTDPRGEERRLQPRGGAAMYVVEKGKPLVVSVK
jgi:hypothetical protein